MNVAVCRKIIFLFAILLWSKTFAQNYGEWFYAEPMLEARAFHSSVILDNNEVLVVGGDNIKSCEIYNRLLNQWRHTGSLNIDRGSFFNLIKLQSGEVLAIGGFQNKSCEVYDPNQEIWAFTCSINTLVWSGKTAVLLNDGRVLIAGGVNYSLPVTYHAECELYNPSSNNWEITDSLIHARSYHSMTLLPDNTVLVAGGNNTQGPVSECEIYNPITEKWELTASLNIPRYMHSATLLPNGKLLVTGGHINDISYTSSCEVYDPVEKTWNVVDNLNRHNELHSGIILDDYRILLTGGFIWWELYDYKNFQSIFNSFIPSNSNYSNVHKLHTGEVITIGGIISATPFMYFTDIVMLYDATIPNAIEIEPPLMDFELFQNYPNPFNPTTNVKFSLPVESNITIKIFNLIGQEVAEAVNGNYAAGSYTIAIDGSSLSSGLYFYTLNAVGSDGKDFTSTKKMLLLR